ncbi:hypothetical protein WN51_13942 [Melipona quadrifasciata]|uniref:Uncharacterized protein n=1 Tax=Melipona quadrifasciata TaxID=166423 RepID=A0A0N0BG06_9HYME|nr:hypothetical protein WN51_13942 [Melipona quadrifasciata]
MATDSNNRQGVRAVATTTTDPQRSEKRAVAARGAAGALALSILALVLQSATTATPTWGYFTNPDASIICKCNRKSETESRPFKYNKVKCELFALRKLMRLLCGSCYRRLNHESSGCDILNNCSTGGRIPLGLYSYNNDRRGY